MILPLSSSQLMSLRAGEKVGVLLPISTRLDAAVALDETHSDFPLLAELFDSGGSLGEKKMTKS